MPKTTRYITLGLICAITLSVAYRSYMHLSEANKRSEHYNYVANCLYMLVNGFPGNPINHRWSVSDEVKFGNSWRLYYTLTCLWEDAGEGRGDGNQPWQSDSLRSWDDRIQFLFCIQKAREFPRDHRYANLMAIRGPGSAFDFMDEHGLDELREVAPDAVLLSEVANSKIPWMQAGDLELDKLPHVINPTSKMGAGSSRGYDQFGVGFADGEVWFLKTSVPFDELAKFLTVDSAREYDRQEVLGQYRVPYEVPVGYK